MLPILQHTPSHEGSSGAEPEISSQNTLSTRNIALPSAFARYVDVAAAASGSAPPRELRHPLQRAVSSGVRDLLINSHSWSLAGH